MVRTDPPDAADFARELHERYAPGMGLLQRPVAYGPLERRLAGYMDPLDLGNVYPIPAWVLGINDVHHALRAARYRLAGIERVERQAEEIVNQAVTQVDRIQVPSNTSISLPDLTFEYEAYLFDVKRAFEYLIAVVAGAFDVEVPDHGSKLVKAVQDTPHGDYRGFVQLSVVALTAARDALPDYFKHESRRNTAAHIQPVQAGNFQVFLDPGLPACIGLSVGGHSLPGCGGHSAPRIRLADVLGTELRIAEDCVFAVLETLPTPNKELENARLS
jgi:hypothetical protein